jgi:adenylate kinase
MGRRALPLQVRLVLLGPPGSGKGTQAARLREALHLPHLSSGHLLREAVAAGTPLGRQAKPLIERGALVPDAVVGDMIAERIQRQDAAHGFILDGFPRTVGQAKMLEEALAKQGLALDAVLHIAVNEAALIERIRERARGAKQRGEQPRSDDDAEVFKQRMASYRAETEPLIEHYRKLGKLRTVDGALPVSAVSAQLLAAIGA